MSNTQTPYEIKKIILRDGLHMLFVGASLDEWQRGYSPDDGIWAPGEKQYLGEFCNWARRSLDGRCFVPFDPDSQPKKLAQVLDIMDRE